MEPKAYIDVLNASEFLPGLLNEWLVDGYACRWYAAVNCPKAFESTCEARNQAFMQGKVGLIVEGLDAKLGSQAVEFLDGALLNVQHSNISSHFADGVRCSETDTLCASSNQIVTAS